MKPALARATHSLAPALSPSRFILDPARDAALIVAAPLWILPLTFLVAAVVSDRAVNTAVFALGSIGHHLPGMLRAYGDRALFARFRARFILGPLALGALCVGFAANGLHALVLIAFGWGIWHGLMQTYGFARIYAAKSGDGDRRSARLDFALLAAWFIGAVLLSPQRLTFLLDMGRTCGVPFPSPSLLATVKIAAAGAILAATVAWLIGGALAWRAGRRPDPVRCLLLATSIGFWCFANLRIRHPLLGVPLFEVFHDVQYLTIVWVFNRRRSDGAPREVRPLLRALFRPSASAVLIYVVAVCGYGAALGLTAPSGGFGDLMSGLLAASQLLHFYYDGFIWKVREPKTAAALGVVSSATPPSRNGLRHALLWGWLAVPAIALGIGEAGGAPSPRERIPTLLALVPDNSLIQFTAAEMHWARGDSDEALAGFRRTLELDPSYAPARDNLALSLGQLADAAFAVGDAVKLRRAIDDLERLRPTITTRAIADDADATLARYAEARRRAP